MIDDPSVSHSQPASPSVEKEFHDRFMLPMDGLWDSLEEASEKLRPDLKTLAGVFRGNLESALTVVTIPFTMAYTGVINTRLNALIIAARIRARAKLDENAEDSEELLFKSASQTLDAELANPEAVNRFADQTIRQLVSLSKRSDFQAAITELLLETVVMMWGAFENFVTEVIRVQVNSKPRLGVELLTNESTKKHFPYRGISVDELANHNFNVATSLGDLLLKDRHLESLPVVKDVLGVIFPTNSELRRALGNPDLWLLWQRRHLIVHRRGVIDAAYLAKTSDARSIGSRLFITPRMLRQVFRSS